jgi:hypothetical protein
MKISSSAIVCALLSLCSLGTGHLLAQQEGQASDAAQNRSAASASNEESVNAQEENSREGANADHEREQAESSAEESQARGNQNGSGDEAQQEKKVLKIHELKNIEASALMAVLRQATTSTQASYVSGYRGVAAGMPGAGGLQGAGGQGLSIAANDDSKLIFLRGPQKQVDDAMKMITYLDSKDNNEPLKLDGTTLIPVKQKHYAALTTVIQGLGLSSRFTSAGTNAFIIIEDGEDEAKRQDAEQVMQIVEKLTGALDQKDESRESEGERSEQQSDSTNGQQQSQGSASEQENSDANTQNDSDAE